MKKRVIKPVKPKTRKKTFREELAEIESRQDWGKGF